MSRGTNQQDRGEDRSFYNQSRYRSNDSETMEHRRKLEALFSNGLGQGSTEQTTSSSLQQPRPFQGTSGNSQGPGNRKFVSRAPTEYRMRLERLRIAREPQSIQEAADIFLAHHHLPDDLEVLYKLLKHPSEKVLRDTMGHISSLMMQGRVPSTVLLGVHLSELKERVQEEPTKSYIDGLQNQIALLESKKIKQLLIVEA